MKDLKNILLWLVLLAMFIAMYTLFNAPPPPLWTAAELSDAVDRQEVERIDVELRDGLGHADVRLAQGRRAMVTAQPLGVFTELAQRGAVVVFQAERSRAWVAAQWLPFAVVVALIIWILRAFSGKSTQSALEFTPTPVVLRDSVTLQGLDALRSRLAGIASAVKEGRPGPRRILIEGPPGAGKTSLLRAMAVDSGIQFLARPGADFVEIFVGIGASRVRTLFRLAAGNQPCLVAIDDVDAFATARRVPDEQNHSSEHASTLLALTDALDGLQPLPPRVLFVATTSRVDLIDPALLRAGRCELRVRLRGDGTWTLDEPAPPAPA